MAKSKGEQRPCRICGKHMWVCEMLFKDQACKNLAGFHIEQQWGDETIVSHQCKACSRRKNLPVRTVQENYT